MHSMMQERLSFLFSFPYLPVRVIALWHILALLSTAPNEQDNNPCAGDVDSHELAPRLLKGATEWHVCTGLRLASTYRFDDARCLATFQKFLPDGGLEEHHSYSYAVDRSQRGRCERQGYGTPIGVKREYLASGQLRCEQDWGDGGTLISERSWDESGRLRLQSVRSSPSAKVHTLKAWDAAGTLVEEQQLVVGTGVRDGRTRRWTDAGVPTLDAWFSNGIPVQRCRLGLRARVHWERGGGLGRNAPRLWRSECADDQGRLSGWAFGAAEPALVYAKEYSDGAPTGRVFCWRDEAGGFISGEVPLSIDAGASLLVRVDANECVSARRRP